MHKKVKVNVNRQIFKSISIILLIFLFFFPHFLLAFFRISSYTIGVIFTCVVFLLLKFVKIKKKLISRKEFFNFLLIFLFISVHGLIASNSAKGFEHSKFIMSVILLILFLIASKYFGKLFLNQNNNYFNKSLKVIFIIFLLNSLVPLFGIRFFDGNSPVGIFLEPSYFALTIAPFLFYISLAKTKGYIYVLIYFFLWGLIIESLIMSLIILGCIILIVLQKNKYLLLFIPVALMLIIPNIESEYYTERFDLSSESTNISVLFYLKGWEQAKQAIIDTSGFGLGFQQLGYVKLSKIHAATAVLDSFNLGSMARHGGSGVVIKSASEFGFFALFFAFLYLWYCIRILIFLLQKKREDLSKAKLFLFCCVLSLFYEMFVRDIGYFSTGFFLFFSCMFNLNIKKLKKQGNLLVTNS
jgi:hypothetical protein